MTVLKFDGTDFTAKVNYPIYGDDGDLSTSVHMDGNYAYYTSRWEGAFVTTKCN